MFAVSASAQQQTTVSCGGISFNNVTQIGRITVTISPESVCANLQKLMTEAGANGSFAAYLSTTSTIRSQSDENLALVLDAFRWRDPVIYDTVTKQYGINVH